MTASPGTRSAATLAALVAGVVTLAGCANAADDPEDVAREYFNAVIDGDESSMRERIALIDSGDIGLLTGGSVPGECIESERDLLADLTLSDLESLEIEESVRDGVEFDGSERVLQVRSTVAHLAPTSGDPVIRGLYQEGDSWYVIPFLAEGCGG